MRIKNIISFLVLIGLAACDNKVAYNHYEHTPPSGWEKNDTLTFSVPPISTSGIYHEELGLRIENSYPFMDLTLTVLQVILPKGDIQRYTLDCSLMDENGYPKGRGVNFYQYSFPLDNIKLNEGDSLKICVVHNMKREIMPGIADIGISLKAE